MKSSSYKILIYVCFLCNCVTLVRITNMLNILYLIYICLLLKIGLCFVHCSRYSFTDRSLKTINTDKLLFGKLLHFINGGQRVSCLDHPEFDHDNKQKPQKVHYPLIILREYDYLRMGSVQFVTNTQNKHKL